MSLFVRLIFVPVFPSVDTSQNSPLETLQPAINAVRDFFFDKLHVDFKEPSEEIFKLFEIFSTLLFYKKFFEGCHPFFDF